MVKNIIKKSIFLLLLFTLLLTFPSFAALDDKLVHCYPFDTDNELNSTVSDEPWLNTGTIINTTQFKVGDAARSFDGDNDRLTTLFFNAVWWGKNMNASAISMWIYPDIIEPNGQFYGCTVAPRFWMMVDSQSSNNYSVAVGTGSSYLTGQPAPLANNWYHILWNFDQGVNTFYVNGQQPQFNESYTVFNPPCDPRLGSDAGSRFFNGVIDQVVIWNRSISHAEVVELYNDGDGIDCTFVTADVTPPVITVETINLTFNDTYNQVPLDINFTTNENATCTLNESTWTLNSTNNSVFVFRDNNETEEKFYAIDINCTDVNANSAIQPLYFTVDRTPPFINAVSPDAGGTTSVYTQGTFAVNVSGTDNLALYSYVANITKVSDSMLMWNYTNTTISSEASNISEFFFYEVIDVSTWENTSYSYNNELCDAHTAKKIKDKDKVKKVNKKADELIYEFPDDINISILSTGGDEDSTDSLEGVDRYRPKFNYKKNTANKVFKLNSNKKISRIDNEAYPGWFVVADRYWVDFDSGDDVTVEQIDGVWTITVANSGKEITFNSIGPLNCKKESYLFEFIAGVSPVITITSPIGNQDIALGEQVTFNIEATDGNAGETISYEWKVDNVTKAVTEDLTYTFVPGGLGTVFQVQVIATDDSPFSYTDEEFWNMTVIKGYSPTYETGDIDNIIVDLLGNFAASWVIWVGLIVLLLVVIFTTGRLDQIIERFNNNRR